MVQFFRSLTLRIARRRRHSFQSAIRIPQSAILLFLPLLLTGCNDRSLKQRTEEIREFSNREDRAYIAAALDHVRRNYWSVRDHSWYGRLPDGTIVRIDAPHVTPAPLPSTTFYRGWHLQLTVSAAAWRTYPPASHKEPFAVVYAITRHNATNWEIRVSQGSVTTPLRREDAAQLPASDLGP